MLLLDHICDQCNSLIVGKRASCTECDDFDLCVMCERDVRSGRCALKSSKHTSAHRVKHHEPLIMVAKPTETSDAVVYTYLHAQFLFSILTLKLSQLVTTDTDTDTVWRQEAQQAHRSCVDFLIETLDDSSKPLIRDVTHEQQQPQRQRLDFYATYSQEYLVGLLASVVQSRSLQALKQVSDDDETLDADELRSRRLLRFVLAKLVQNNSASASQLEESVHVMYLNVFKALVVANAPIIAVLISILRSLVAAIVDFIVLFPLFLPLIGSWIIDNLRTNVLI